MDDPARDRFVPAGYHDFWVRYLVGARALDGGAAKNDPEHDVSFGRGAVGEQRW